MLYEAKTLKGYKLHSLDGQAGKVKEFYFDDHQWKIRFLVAETGNWLIGKQVLISEDALGAVNKEEQYININLTSKQIEDSPSLESARQTYPNLIIEQMDMSESYQGKAPWDPQIRSTYDSSGSKIDAMDGELGSIDDFIIDDKTWEIRYLIVNAKNWWPDKKILVTPKWSERVNWAESNMFINLPRETFKRAKEYTDESQP